MKESPFPFHDPYFSFPLCPSMTVDDTTLFMTLGFSFLCLLLLIYCLLTIIFGDTHCSFSFCF